ncbi:MAG: hypothetical protein M1840_006509 [Geoglossum simile]|nr:MAG: hypothetical protein M1840_006509 [Geoglossum simile]
MTVYNSDSDMIIAESPTDTEGLIFIAFTGRKDDLAPEGSQTEGRKDIAGANKTPLSIPLWVCRLNSKLNKLGSIQLHIISRLEALDKRVDSLEKARDGMRNTIKDVQDSISSLQKAADKRGTHIDEELEELKNESTTKWGGISVSLCLGF